MTTPRLSLILGGARSGKSRFALDRAMAAGLSPVFVATAEAYDDEMRARIQLHQNERAGMMTVEAPLELGEALATSGQPGRILLIDCLTLWLTNVMLAERDVAAAGDDLIAALDSLACPAVLVSNEVGMGIVPENALARRFRDAQGRLNQQIAAVADEVVFVAAGLPLYLKRYAS